MASPRYPTLLSLAGIAILSAAAAPAVSAQALEPGMRIRVPVGIVVGTVAATVGYE